MPRLEPRSANVVLDASGQGYVAFAIDNSNRKWSVDSVHVETNQARTQTPIPRAATYKNNLGAPQAAQGGTSSGNFDDASGQTDLYAGDVLYVQWTGGIPGTTATAVIGGDFTR